MKKSLLTAFVQGAQWWEYRRTGATMWGDDRREAEEEAEKRHESKTLGISLIDRLEGTIKND